MARRQSYPNVKFFQRPSSPYARTEGWTTRYYTRKVDGTTVASLSGLNTTSDDFAKKEGESPFLANCRLFGSKEKIQRAQSMSRMGQRFNGVPSGSEVVSNYGNGDERVEVQEYKSVMWRVKSTERITSIGLYAHLPANVNTNAYLVLIIRKPESKEEVCRVAMALNQNAKHHLTNGLNWFRLIRTVIGDFYIEATLVDDMNDTGDPLGTQITLESRGDGNHTYSLHDLPNLDHALREEAYEYGQGVSRPVTETKSTTWKTFPIWIQNGYFTRADKNRYIPIGVINGAGEKVIYLQKYLEREDDGSFTTVYDAPINEILIPAHKINQNADTVRMTQAGKHLFFVDGFSPLQQVDLETLVVDDAKPTSVDMFGFQPNMYYYRGQLIWQDNAFWRANVDHQGAGTWAESQGNWTNEGNGESLTAWPGASLIYFLNNRLFLGGFRRATVGIPPQGPKPEPNLTIMSSIDSIGPKYAMFNRTMEFFYSPDRAPSSTASSPLTGYAHIGDSLIAFRPDGMSIFQIAAAVEYGGVSQVNPEGNTYGVQRQEHIVEGLNNIFFLNPTAGILRFGGSISTKLSGPVDTYFQRINDADYNTVRLAYMDDLLRVYTPGEDHGEYNNECLIDYVNIPQHRSYWFRDTNTPIAYAFTDMGHNIQVGVGSEYPCSIFIEEGFKDFDCAIEYIYYTKYLTTPDKIDGTIVRRLHLTTLQDFNSSVFIGLDYDHNNTPIVWRRFITKQSDGIYTPEDIFGDDKQSGSYTTSVRILTHRTRYVQIRLKQYCYDYQAEILRVGLEYSNATKL